MSIIYKKGDLFAALSDKKNIIVPHVCNVHGVMGSGFAKTVREKYPETNKDYINYCKDYNMHNIDFYIPDTLFTIEDFGMFGNMICQTGLSGSGVRNATYPDLIICMRGVLYEWRDRQEYEIYAPKFGAGLCGMNWDFIEELIKDIWLDAGIKVTVFTL